MFGRNADIGQQIFQKNKGQIRDIPMRKFGEKNQGQGLGKKSNFPYEK